MFACETFLLNGLGDLRVSKRRRALQQSITIGSHSSNPAEGLASALSLDILCGTRTFAFWVVDWYEPEWRITAAYTLCFLQLAACIPNQHIRSYPVRAFAREIFERLGERDCAVTLRHRDLCQRSLDRVRDAGVSVCFYHLKSLI